MRFGPFRPGIARFVLELSGNAGILRHFRLGSSGTRNDRAVVDVLPLSRLNGRPPAIAEKKAESDDWIAFAFLAEEFRTTRKASPAPVRTDDGRRIIVFDPGHGGIDPGASTKGGTREKHIVLRAALILRDMFQATGRYDVHLTRAEDVFVPLGDRFRFAEQKGADLLISIHADSHPTNRKLRGSTVYVLSEKASDAAAAKLAQLENKSDVIAGENLEDYSAEISNILIDLAQSGTMSASHRLAEIAHVRLADSRRNVPGGVRSAGFAVLKSPTVPSMLLELGYLSNPNEEKILKDPEHLKTIGARLLTAIDQWFASPDR